MEREPTDLLLIKEALAAYAQPSRLRKAGLVPLPGALNLLKLAAGDDELSNSLSGRFGVSSSDLRSASELYLRSIVANAGADRHKLLLLPTNATPEMVRTHMRWMLKWLHPDRNQNSWDIALFRRVSTAGKALTAEIAAPTQVNTLPVPVQEIAVPSARHARHRKRPRLKLMQRRKTQPSGDKFRHYLKVGAMVFLGAAALGIGKVALDALQGGTNSISFNSDINFTDNRQ